MGPRIGRGPYLAVWVKEHQWKVISYDVGKRRFSNDQLLLKRQRIRQRVATHMANRAKYNTEWFGNETICYHGSYGCNESFGRRHAKGKLSRSRKTISYRSDHGPFQRKHRGHEILLFFIYILLLLF